MVEADQGASELDEGQVVVGLPLPTDEQAAETVVPSVGPLDDPSPGRAANATEQRRLSSPASVGDDPPAPQANVNDLVVVALVQAAMDRPPPMWRAASGVVYRVQCHPHVGHIGPAEHDAERDPFRVREEMAFRATLGPIGGVSARVIPPLGALTMTPSSAVHIQSMPTWSS